MGQLVNPCLVRRSDIPITEEKIKIMLRTIAESSVGVTYETDYFGGPPVFVQADKRLYAPLMKHFRDIFDGLDTVDRCRHALNVTVGIHSYAPLHRMGENLFAHASIEVKDSELATAQTEDEKCSIVLQLSEILEKVFNAFGAVYECGKSELIFQHGYQNEGRTKEFMGGMRMVFESVEELHSVLRKCFGIRMRRELERDSYER